LHFITFGATKDIFEMLNMEFMKKFSDRSNLLLLLFLIFWITQSCVNLNPTDTSDMNSGVIPKDFDWKTIKELSCTVKVTSTTGIADNTIRVIKIFNSSQMDQGSLVASGAATPASPFVVKISLATTVPALYIQELLPDGSKALKVIDVKESTLMVTFAAPIVTNVPAPSNSSFITANVPVDNDGDGVASFFDVDDNDASVAFVSYFPSESTWGTYVFEDMWPVKGDYDLNDLVLAFRISYYTNALNLVSRFRLDYNMEAAGSTYSIGAAFQLNLVAASNVQTIAGQSLTGTSPFQIEANGTENGVIQAVIPLFNNQKDVVAYTEFLNTVSGENIATADQYVSINFITPFQQADIAMSAFNMFIVANGRGREIHLPAYTGTSKFDASLADGYTLFPGDMFKNSDGMMWGIMIPRQFSYPEERCSIVNAYNFFSDWATSGGVNHDDWYLPTLLNMNIEKIYQL